MFICSVVVGRVSRCCVLVTTNYWFDDRCYMGSCATKRNIRNSLVC